MDTHGKDMLDIETATNFRRRFMASFNEINYLNDGKSFKFHVEQCKSLCRYILDKLSPYIKDDGPYLGHYVSSKNVQRAWKEIYRAMKEAETYLKLCSTDSWLMKCFVQANTGEAFTLHMHDLAWSLLCLDLALPCSIETWIGKIHLKKFRNRICDFFAEMSDLHLEQFGFKFQDHWHLLMASNQMAVKAWTSKQKNKILPFMERKLLEAIRNECQIEPATAIPTWLQIPPKDLIFKRKTIGEGSFGVVYEGSWLGHKVAVKDIPIDARDLFDKEIAALAKLQSPFIVQLIGTCIQGSHCYIIMELVSSSLDKILTNSAGRAPLALPVAVDMMLQISRGMEYLHRQGIMHMDLKSSNVLIEPSAVPEFREQGYGRVKLCDFGMASLRLSSFRCEDPKGTCYWRTPEAFPFPNEELLQEIDSLNEYTYKADVYSFAMTCYEILTGKQPFLGVHPKDLYRMILQRRRPILQPTSCPAVLADYIVKCWETDPRHRPCFAEVSTFMRKMKLFILRRNDPRDWLVRSGGYFYLPEVSLEPVTSKEEAFDDSPADEKLELITMIVQTVPSEIKSYNRRYNINVARAVPSEKSNGQIDHSLFMLLDMWDSCDPQDFFRSTWAVLGKNRFGSTIHRANLRDFFLVVKRLSKDTTYASEKRYFGRLLRVLRSLEHANLGRLPAFHISEEERLLIYNYGSLYSVLHTKGKPLNWDRRMKIAMNVAACLAFLHKSGMPYGNVNSSNILLDNDGNAFLANANVARNSSEYMERHRSAKISEESDVHRFGVLLVELFSGRNPSSGLTSGRIAASDMMLMGYRGTIRKVRGMLAVAMLCVSPQIYTRPLMSDVVKMIHAVQNSYGMVHLIVESFLSESQLLSRLYRLPCDDSNDSLDTAPIYPLHL